MEFDEVIDQTIDHYAMNDGEIYLFKIYEDDPDDLNYYFWMTREEAIDMAKEILRALDE